MSKAKNTFDQNMDRAGSFLTAYRELHGKRGRVPKARADLLRGCVVFSVAALDAYVRDVVGENLARIVSAAVKHKRKLPPQLIKMISSAMDTEALVKAAYAKRTGSHIRSAIEGLMGRDSFQGPRAIEEALEIIGVFQAIDKIADKSGEKRKSWEKRLREVTDRRHKIVHQADVHAGRKMKRRVRTITVKFAEDALVTIKEFVDQLEFVIAEQVRP